MNNRIIVGVLIAMELILSYGFGSRIWTLWRAQERIEVARVKKEANKQEYEKKLAELAYIKTDTYVEEIARTKLGFAREGDAVYIVPENKRESVVLDEVVLPHSSGLKNTRGEIYNWWRLFFK
jgi:cell division protein FtsB